MQSQSEAGNAVQWNLFLLWATSFYTVTCVLIGLDNTFKAFPIININMRLNMLSSHEFKTQICKDLHWWAINVSLLTMVKVWPLVLGTSGLVLTVFVLSRTSADNGATLQLFVLCCLHHHHGDCSTGGGYSAQISHHHLSAGGQGHRRQTLPF